MTILKRLFGLGANEPEPTHMVLPKGDSWSFDLDLTESLASYSKMTKLTLPSQQGALEKYWTKTPQTARLGLPKR